MSSGIPKKTTTPFHQSMLVCIEKIIAGKPSSVVRLLLQSIAYDQIEGKRKICQID